MDDIACPACDAAEMVEFHRQAGVPANSCLLLDTAAEATSFPRGEIVLGLCPNCGLISNMAFDPGLAEYSSRYEETQACSPRFVRFARELAGSWVERYGLHDKTVLEIGCGKGEFLTMMAEAGIGRGVGIDPGVDSTRIDSPAADRLEWIADLFTEEHATYQADAIVCRHTLEHISPVGDFVRLLRRTIGDRLDTAVLFELPDTQRVLDEVAFWDVYYEHCTYFTRGSLTRLFQRCGFEVIDLSMAYDDQYLILEARPVPEGAPIVGDQPDDMASLHRGVEGFATGYRAMIGQWRHRLDQLRKETGTAVIWGGGSKGVSFLTAAGRGIEAVVDINPRKQGKFMAGTGHRVVAPDELEDIKPDLVIVMNPIYLDEIGRELAGLGIETDVVAV